jgi:FkbM family methyltransferase
VNLALLASHCNNLPIWKRRLKVWGYDVAACNGDRLLNLCMHRFGLMGAADKKIYEKLLRPGSTVVEIGANQGLYSLLFSGLVGPQGRVFAFEPDQTLFLALQENCQRNRATNVCCYNYAIGAKNEARTLYHSRVNSGDNRLVASDRPDWFYEVGVQTRTLDSLLADTHVDFIKIDVQGWELEVLEGMTEIFRKNQEAIDIYFEFWPFGLRRAGRDPVELLDYFRRRGFSLSDMTSQYPRAIEDFRSFCSGVRGYTNILAVRAGSE